MSPHRSSSLLIALAEYSSREAAANPLACCLSGVRTQAYCLLAADSICRNHVEKTEHVRSEKRQIEGGMGGTKMTIKTKKGLKIPLLCQEKTEHVRSLPLKNGAC